jgi:outer membrane protein insertion porin family
LYIAPAFGSAASVPTVAEPSGRDHGGISRSGHAKIGMTKAGAAKAGAARTENAKLAFTRLPVPPPFVPPPMNAAALLGDLARDGASSLPAAPLDAAIQNALLVSAARIEVVKSAASQLAAAPPAGSPDAGATVGVPTDGEPAQVPPAEGTAPAQPADATTPAPPAGRARVAAVQPGGLISEIKVEGNQRIEAGTIRSYMLAQAGQPYDPDQVDRSLKTLYDTGLFSDVNIRREGSVLVVHVTENPIVNQIVFEGNHKLTDEVLRPELTLRPRAVFTPALAQADRQKLLDYYAKHGRFAATIEPKIIQLDQNRVNVVFEISEGDNTLVSRISFVGNHAFSESRLRDIIGSREEAWYRFLSSSDTYDPERVNFDKELLRRFYLQKGYADVDIVSATAELAPDKSAFFLTFTINEGARYKISKTEVNVTLAHADKAKLVPLLELSPGDWYDGDAVERSVQAMTTELQNSGLPFAEVKPEIKRNTTDHTIDLAIDVGDGPRVYVERIDIVGNQRTMDKVIRREFKLAEGDPFNAALIRRSRQAIQDLDYFQNVEISSQQGSAPDKSVLTTTIQEKATGELTIGGGYSTDVGALATVGLREKNLIGTGIDAGITGTLAQKESQVDLSVTDPYFLDRNIVTGFDIFRTETNNLDVEEYSERRTGANIRIGYAFNDHLRQLWTYSVVQRDVYDVQSTASLYVQDQAGQSLLSQIGQTLTLDYRDSKLEPHTGWVMRFGSDFAGLGGDAHFVRLKYDTTYYIPLDRFSGNSDWGIAVSGGVGNLFSLNNNERIIDRFFLGGDNLRGFQTGGVGPHAINGGDSLGGRFLWTQSTELRFPLPVSPDLGLTGRAFVDMGSLSGLSKLVINGVVQPAVDYTSPRIGAGVGVSWKTPFGLINIDLGQAILKQKYDQTQLFRFGFGTRF